MGQAVSRGVERLDDREAERDERPRPVEQHEADPAAPLEQDLRRAAHKVPIMKERVAGFLRHGRYITFQAMEPPSQEPRSPALCAPLTS